MNRLARLSLSLFNIYLVFSVNIIQILCSDRPSSKHSVTADKTFLMVNDVVEVAQVQQVEREQFNQASKLSERSLDLDDEDFFPSRQLDEGFGNKISADEDDFHQDTLGRRAYQRRRVVGKRRVESSQDKDQRRLESNLERDERRVESSPGRYRQRIRFPEQSTYGGYDDYDYFRGSSRVSEPDRYTDGRVPAGYERHPYQDFGRADYFELLRPNPAPHRHRFNSWSSPAREDETRFPAGGRPNPQPPSSNSGGLFGSLLGLLKPPKLPEPARPTSNEPSYEFVYNSLDYTDKISDYSDTFIPTLDDYDDYNLDYADNQNSNGGNQYSFKDVLYSIRDNETKVETLKKFLSAASSLTDRASTDPAFMFFNMPITLLSILGGFYAVSAIAVISYKYFLLTTGSTNGAAVALTPVLVSFLVPALIVTVYLVVRSAVDGQINLGGLARGDLKAGLRQDFDPVDFVYNTAVGSTALLGLGWIVSVVI